MTAERTVDEGVLRRFVASRRSTLPGSIEIELFDSEDERYRFEVYVYENPNDVDDDYYDDEYEDG